MRRPLVIALLLVAAGCGNIDIGNNGSSREPWNECADGCDDDDWGDEDDDWGEQDDGGTFECTDHAQCAIGEGCDAGLCTPISIGEAADCGKHEMVVITVASLVSTPSDVVVGNFNDGSEGQDMMLLYPEDGALERVDLEVHVRFEDPGLAAAHTLVGLAEEGVTPRLMVLSDDGARVLEAHEGEPALTLVEGLEHTDAPVAALYGQFANYVGNHLALVNPDGVEFYRLLDTGLHHIVQASPSGQLLDRVDHSERAWLRYLDGSELIDVASNRSSVRGSMFPSSLTPTVVAATVDASGEGTVALAEAAGLA